MPDGNAPFGASFEGVIGWYDLTRTTVTDPRTRVRRIAQAFAADAPYPLRGDDTSLFARLLYRRTRIVVRSLYS